jgi:hypothetical protein
MLLSSGAFHQFRANRNDPDHSTSTQESLDEGVEKIRQIYKSFENVGIKDRSMIWNSYGRCSHDPDPFTHASVLVILSRLLSCATSFNVRFKLSLPQQLARSPEVLTHGRITLRFVFISLHSTEFVSTGYVA